jgi:hypothetical protein
MAAGLCLKAATAVWCGFRVFGILRRRLDALVHLCFGFGVMRFSAIVAEVLMPFCCFFIACYALLLLSVSCLMRFPGVSSELLCVVRCTPAIKGVISAVSLLFLACLRQW